MDLSEFEDKPSEDRLDRLREFARAVVAQKEEVEELEEQLRHAKSLLHKLQNKELVNLMVECGQTQLQMPDGTVAKLKDVYTSSIPSNTAIKKLRGEEQLEAMRRRDAAYDFIKEKAPVLVSQEYSINFGKGQSKKAKEYEEVCRSLGLKAEAKETINANSLRGWLKKHLSDLTEDQKALLGADQIQRVEVK